MKKVKPKKAQPKKFIGDDLVPGKETKAKKKVRKSMHEGSIRG